MDLTTENTEKSREKQSLLTNIDICEAREALSKDMENRPRVICLTPGEYQHIVFAFEKMKREIKRYQSMTLAEFALEVHNRKYNNNQEGDK